MSKATETSQEHVFQKIKELLNDEVAENVEEPIERHFENNRDKRKATEKLENQTMRLALAEDQKRGRPIYQSLMLRAIDDSYSAQEEAELAAPKEGTHIWTKKLDDIEDGDHIRNGEQTLHSFARENILDDEVAEWVAINHIIGLRSRNYKAITDSDQLDDSQKLNLLEIIWDAEQDLAEGQNYDILGSKIAENPELRHQLTYDDGDFDMMDYLFDTNHLKTAALFRASAESVAELTGYEKEELVNSANKTGQAFQIWDDALDFQTERNSDIEEANYTVPLYIAERHLQTHPEPQKNKKGEYLQSILSDSSPTVEEIEEATRIIREETPAIEASENLSKHLIQQANDYIDNVDWENPEYAEELKEFNELLGYKRPK